MEYGDTLTLIYPNKYQQKKEIKGAEIIGTNFHICHLQFYDAKGKPISNKDYEVLLKKKSKWWYKLLRENSYIAFESNIAKLMNLLYQFYYLYKNTIYFQQ
jgi:hypothetical protein